MVEGPELARMTQEFEESIPSVTKEDTRHHEQVPRVQVLFKKDVASLVSSFEEVGNPFEEDAQQRSVCTRLQSYCGKCSHPNSQEGDNHGSGTVQYICRRAI